LPLGPLLFPFSPTSDHVLQMKNIGGPLTTTLTPPTSLFLSLLQGVFFLHLPSFSRLRINGRKNHRGPLPSFLHLLLLFSFPLLRHVFLESRKEISKGITTVPYSLPFSLPFPPPQEVFLFLFPLPFSLFICSSSGK